jgi:hypothetical protein
VRADVKKKLLAEALVTVGTIKGHPNSAAWTTKGLDACLASRAAPAATSTLSTAAGAAAAPAGAADESATGSEAKQPSLGADSSAFSSADATRAAPAAQPPLASDPRLSKLRDAAMRSGLLGAQLMKAKGEHGFTREVFGQVPTICVFH